MRHAEKALGEAVGEIQQRFPAEEAMGYIDDLSRLDRYQASRDIEIAADMVAAWADGSGLSSVEITKFPADGQRHWWTFRAPSAWTPLEASVSINGGDLTAYPRDPCSLATYSSAVQLRSLQIGRELVVVPRSDDSLSSIIEKVEKSGADGFVTDAVSTEDQVGRIELPLSSRLFGFSVRPSVLKRLSDVHAAEVMVTVDRTASMPVVMGVVPGNTDEEVWLQAHLCHVRPGANDNLSGVAALLGLVSSFAGTTPQKTIRFLWGPEFVGTAAVLHERTGRPTCVLNLDMVGEDQTKCGGPLVAERSPDHVPSFLSALVEAAADAIPPGSWNWRAAPFAGTSDHLLYADRSIARPAVHLGHWPDRFNHSSEDTIDKVDPEELARSSAIAGAAALVAAGATDLSAPDLVSLVDAWGNKRVSEVKQMNNYSEGLLAHTEEVVRGSRGESHELEPPEDDALVRKWPGPFNLRGLLEDAGDSNLRAGRDDFVKMTALALAIDDRSSRSRVISRAAYSSLLPIEPGFGHGFLETMIDAGWVGVADRD